MRNGICATVSASTDTAMYTHADCEYGESSLAPSPASASSPRSHTAGSMPDRCPGRVIENCTLKIENFNLLPYLCVLCVLCGKFRD